MEDKAEGMVIWAIAESVGRLVVERVQAFTGAIMQNPLTGTTRPRKNDGYRK